jgi:lactoylglutathione lyase
MTSLEHVAIWTNDRIHQQHLGIIHLSFGVDTMSEVDEKANELRRDGHVILRGPRKTGDGYYEFETLDPDSNRLEVASLYVTSTNGPNP